MMGVITIEQKTKEKAGAGQRWKGERAVSRNDLNSEKGS